MKKWNFTITRERSWASLWFDYWYVVRWFEQKEGLSDAWSWFTKSPRYKEMKRSFNTNEQAENFIAEMVYDQNHR